MQEYRRTLLSQASKVPEHERLRLRSLRRSLIAAEAPQEGGFIEVLGPAGNASVPIAGDTPSSLLYKQPMAFVCLQELADVCMGLRLPSR